MLLCLAPELIQAISRELESIEDTKSFRLTCKHTDQALATEILRCITVDINEKNFEKELHKLQYFAERSSSCRTIRGIRQLDIKSLSSPALDPQNPRALRESAEGVETTHEEELKKCLYNALSSLTTVRTVRWTPNLDGEWAHTAVVDALKMLPNLQRLYIASATCQIEIPFHLFTALQHIDVQCVSEEIYNEVYHRKTFENIVKMISESPLLQSICLSNDHGRTTRSLHHLFECYPETLPPLRLKHLSLENFYVRLDDETVMRHLKHLTSLSLESILEPPSLDSDGSDSIHKDILEKQTRWGSTHEQIWTAISNNNLRLEAINLDTTPLAFSEYIASYSGLKKLKIITRGYRDGVTSDNAANKFYETLENHADSIEELDVIAFFEGLWCFGHHNLALFSTLQHLRTLSVTVRSSDFIPSSKSKRSSSKNIINVLIDTTVTYMPQLEWLFVSVGNLESSRGSRCGTHSGIQREISTQKMVGRVLQYRAPLDCKRLPTFKIGWSQAFVGRFPDLPKKGKKRLRYLRANWVDDRN